jgi:hypothetical protein
MRIFFAKEEVIGNIFQSDQKKAQDLPKETFIFLSGYFFSFRKFVGV